jgi:hypothetical protein
MSDTLFALWISLSAVLLVLFVYAAIINLRNRQGKPVVLDDLIPALLPVDIEAFSELIEAKDRTQSTPGLDLKRLQRERAEQTIAILRRMAHNAALLQKLGYGQLNSGNQLISDLAQQMIDAGVHVRLYTFMGLAVLHLCTVLSLDILPAARVAELRDMMTTSLIPAYQQMKDKAGNLTCLKFAGLHEALNASL